MTPEAALQNLYNASRLASLTAEQHEFLVKCVNLIAEALKKEENERNLDN